MYLFFNNNVPHLQNYPQNKLMNIMAHQFFKTRFKMASCIINTYQDVFENILLTHHFYIPNVDHYISSSYGLFMVIIIDCSQRSTYIHTFTHLLRNICILISFL